MLQRNKLFCIFDKGIAASDSARMKEIFEARIEHGASDTTYPETAIHWANNGQVHTYGNYVCMIVLPEGYIIPENVFELE